MSYTKHVIKSRGGVHNFGVLFESREKFPNQEIGDPKLTCKYHIGTKRFQWLSPKFL